MNRKNIAVCSKFEIKSYLIMQQETKNTIQIDLFYMTIDYPPFKYCEYTIDINDRYMEYNQINFLVYFECIFQMSFIVTQYMLSINHLENISQL